MDSDVEEGFEDLPPLMKRNSSKAETSVYSGVRDLEDLYSGVRDLEDLQFLHSTGMDLRNERWDHESRLAKTR